MDLYVLICSFFFFSITFQRIGEVSNAEKYNSSISHIWMASSKWNGRVNRIFTKHMWLLRIKYTNRLTTLKTCNVECGMYMGGLKLIQNWRQVANKDPCLLGCHAMSLGEQSKANGHSPWIPQLQRWRHYNPSTCQELLTAHIT